ncbi:hypothetical protein HPB47_004825 [Ixodes persulcatus]|uniref:Uncharacterized protein n=1 Tax=Ixodes persulcatus TaxID=34615 RepID=A0AC60PFG1_IXOPE|nr:hypothetical protein HPB47_004825 [Ixodes persulcatus]
MFLASVRLSTGVSSGVYPRQRELPQETTTPLMNELMMVNAADVPYFDERSLTFTVSSSHYPSQHPIKRIGFQV